MSKLFLKLNIQHFAGGSKATLYELKQSLGTVGAQLEKIEGELSRKAADPNAKTEDIRSLQASKDDLRMRSTLLKSSMMSWKRKLKTA